MTRNSQSLWIPGPLPGLNELLAAAKGAGGRGAIYARTKRHWTNTIVLLARSARLRPMARVRLQFGWREPSKRRDPDNVAAGGRKLILDGLVEAQVLPGDGWAVIDGWVDAFETSDAPGCLVVMTEVAACGNTAK